LRNFNTRPIAKPLQIKRQRLPLCFLICRPSTLLYRVILVSALADIARSPFNDATFAIVSVFAFGPFILTRLVSVGLFISILQKIYQGSNAKFISS
jgi:hypothetical protein